MDSSAATPRRWKVSRGVWAEPWRFGLRFRVYHGYGLPKFEFEFRLGFARERQMPEHIELEGTLADGLD